MRSVVRNVVGARQGEEHSRLVDIDVDDGDEHFDDAVDDGSPSFKRNADADILQRLGSRFLLYAVPKCTFLKVKIKIHIVIHE